MYKPNTTVKGMNETLRNVLVNTITVLYISTVDMYKSITVKELSKTSRNLTYLANIITLTL